VLNVGRESELQTSISERVSAIIALAAIRASMEFTGIPVLDGSDRTLVVVSGVGQASSWLDSGDLLNEVDGLAEVMNRSIEVAKVPNGTFRWLARDRLCAEEFWFNSPRGRWTCHQIVVDSIASAAAGRQDR
jgi:hypothetical protein